MKNKVSPDEEVEEGRERENEHHGNHIMQFSTQAPGNFQHERARQASEGEKKVSHNIIKK